ncbi:MAG TPA: hypothetical protein VF995_04440 [Actinomycetota bacterium]
MLNFTRRPEATPELHRFSPLADPVPAYGVGVELTETGMWLRIQHPDGKTESAFVSAPWLRWLAASSVATRAEGFELMKQRTNAASTTTADTRVLRPIGV